MTERDSDIEELNRLLGHTKAEYRALRHDGPMPVAERRRSPRLGRYAAAATVLLALGVATLGTLDHLASLAAERPSRLSMPAPAAAPLSLRPRAVAGQRAMAPRARISVDFRLPRRPMRSAG